MNLITDYQHKINNGLLTQDPIQLDVITKLQHLKEKIEAIYPKLADILPETNFYQKLISYLCLNSRKSMPKGLYLYSDVGRGKTMVMDLFFKNLNLKNKYKLRTHFHLFMRTIHKDLQTATGHSDPIDYIIKSQYKDIKILCLDEFIVTDITDAMILARVLIGLQKYKTILITTSNTAPDNLYKNGLQRSLFLPAINIIKNTMDIINLPGLVDYRTQMLIQASCYYWPCNQSNLKQLKQMFDKLSGENNNFDNKRDFITILERSIYYLAQDEHQNLIWFKFDELCNTPRSQADYLELANLYQTVFISELYQLDDQRLDITRRFITLIDILYDAKVNLIICADGAMDDIYKGQVLKFEFARCLSRLREMQTDQYLAMGHLG